MKQVKKKVKRRLKKKFKIALIVIILVASLTSLTISLLNIFKWNDDNNKTNKQIEEIEEVVNIEETNSEKEEIIEPKEEIEESNPYWDYIKMSLINVDFKELKKINNQTKGWIQVNGTNINYPFVQAKDNKYYLTRSFDKSYNDAGWLFLDYRNNINNLEKNTIIYGHSRLDKTMFGTLKNILKSSWVKNTDNYIVKLSTQTHNTLWQVFSVYRIPTTSDYLQIDFETNEEFNNFANMLLKRSDYNFNTKVNENDKILTLSTCADNDKKVVLHAKLIKKEAR
ncbi:MAG: class B sortase [Bacilli bacterium]|nr:class B sortase [Bacilli bacterium]